MSGDMNRNDSNVYWPQQDDNYAGNYHDADYNQFQNLTFDFQPLEEYGSGFEVSNRDFSPSQMYDPSTYPINSRADPEDELPLLEELEIYPDRIVQKMLAVLNPFRSHGVTDNADFLTKDNDLAGPLFVFVVFGVALFLSGKAHFGYIYGVTVISVLFIYCLFTLMTAEPSLFHLTLVAGILGYSLIPIVGLSVLGVFMSLNGFLGTILALLAVVWSSVSASRLFVTISSDKGQQLLYAYPCALVSCGFVLLIIF